MQTTKREHEETSPPDNELEREIAELRERIAAHETARRKDTERLAQLETELRCAHAAAAEALKRERADLDVALARAQAVADPAARIDLNVGGRLFSFTAEALAAHPHSMLAALSSGRWQPQKRDGVFFIGRSGRLFEYVAEYILDGALDVELSPQDAQKLWREADFYGLVELRDSLKQHTKWIWKQNANVEITNDGLTARDRGNSDESVKVYATVEWTSGCHEWAMRIDADSPFICVVCEDNYYILSTDDGCIYKGDSSPSSDWCSKLSEQPVFGAEKFKSGSIVRVKLDIDNLVLAFCMENTWSTPCSIQSAASYSPSAWLANDDKITIIH